MVCIGVIGEATPSPSPAAKAISSSMRCGRSSSTTFLHSARILGDACEKLRRFSVDGARLNRKRVDETVGRSLMLATALSPVIGYDKASAIAHKANDGDLTLKEAALDSGWIDEKRFAETVDPQKMVGRGLAGS